MCEVIQSSLASVGITVNLISQDTTNWTAFKAGNDYDIFVDCCAYQGALLYNFNRFFYTDGSSNLYDYYSADYEALQDEVSSQTTWDAMVEKFATLQQYVADNIPNFPLAYNKHIFATQSDVERLIMSPTANYQEFSTVYIPSRD